MNWFRWSAHKTQADTQHSNKKVNAKPIKLQLSDRHEPFGSIDIGKIKTILAEEDFTQLQSLYFYMMRDLKIAAAVLTRKQPLLGLSYSIEGDNQACVDWLTDKVKLGDLINQLGSAIYYGVSLTDIHYQVVDGKLLPSFNLISPRFLYAHKDKDLKKTVDHLYIKQGDSKLFLTKLDPDKIVFHKHALDIGEITDFSLASKLVWYFSLKHLTLAHNLQYFDNVATPPLIAKTSGDADTLIDNLYDLKSSSVGVFAESDIIEYLNVQSKADFLRFIEYIDRQITTFILGNTLSTSEGKTGSYSQSQTHEKQQQAILKFDANLIASTISDYLSRLEILNFAHPQGITFKFNLTEKKDLKELSEVVKNLSDSGFELDNADIEQQFGLKIIGKKVSEATAATNKQDNAMQRHCEHNATTLPKHQDTLDSKQTDTTAIEKALLNSIETALKQASNFEEAYELLLEQYTEFDIGALEAALLKAMANSAILAEAEQH